MTNKIEADKWYVVGQVIGAGLAPCVCNSQYSPDHPCRVKVVSVGRKYVKALESGYDTPHNIRLDALWDIQEAKQSYRTALEARDAKWKSEKATCMLGAERIERLVNDL